MAKKAAKKTVKKSVNIQTMDEDKDIAGKKESAPEVQRKASAPRFIENPLPLPKKHEKREMGYQYEIAEDKMYFDVEIKENDDFDIF